MSTVSRLPTAARRKVDNRRFAEQRRAAREAEKAWPGEYRHPKDRAMDAFASDLLAVEQSATTELLRALCAALDDEARRKVAEVLSPAVVAGRASARQAFALFYSTKLSIADQYWLEAALSRAREGA